MQNPCKAEKRLIKGNKIKFEIKSNKKYNTVVL